MKKYKDIRKELGTINYIETETELKNDNVNYIEIYKLNKKEKKKPKSGKTVRKTITIQNDTKKNILEKEIEKINEPEINNNLNDINQIEETIKENLIEKTDKNEKDKKDKKEDKNKKQEEKKQEEDKAASESAREAAREKNEKQEEEKDEQDGGSINPFKKRIYITDLSVDKDKEMFQL